MAAVQGGSSPMEYLVDELILHTTQSQASAGHQEGYRNKIAYTLGKLFSLTPLANAELNQICQSAQNFRTKLQQSFLNNLHPFPDTTLNEVSAKLCRTTEVILRLTLINGSEHLKSLWEHTIGPDFANVITTQHPQVKTITYQWSEGKGKLAKGSGYQTLYGSGFVNELTPNGLPFFVGPDTFSEVNHTADDSIFHQSIIWFNQIYKDQPQTLRDLLVIGRDANTFTWGLMHTGYYKRVHSITTCPCAYRDWHVNRKALGYDETNSFCYLLSHRKHIGGALHTISQCLNHKVSVIVTASRNGLTSDAIEAFRAFHSIEVIVYVSCNQKTIAADFDRLLIQPNPFFIYDFCSWNGLAGTDYLLSACAFIRRPQDLLPPLLLPVGLPGCGKSYLCRLLSHILSSFGFHAKVIERDAVFASFRETCGLKQTRISTHDYILKELTSSLHRSDYALVCLDSTNGSAEARTLYCKEADFCVLVVFESLDLERLVLRCQGRDSDNLAFETLDDIRTKIQNVAKGIEDPTKGDRRRLVHVKEDDNFSGPVTAMLVNVFCAKGLTSRLNNL